MTNLFHPDSHLVIIAGGSGTRFWPKSTSKRPKQLLAFGRSDASQGSHPSLLTQTLFRFDPLVPLNQRLIVTTAMLKEPIEKEKLAVTLLAEPQGRNTAPCVYWAAKHIERTHPKGIMLVMPADHFIEDLKAFQRAIHSAIEWATNHDDLVTLGIQPTRPETGYGYLQVGRSLMSSENSSRLTDPRQVEAFIEKPNLSRAREFLESGKHLWNGGMFVWRVDTILRAFDEYMPEMKKAWDQNQGDVEQAYPKMTATSIDYGIMEKAKNVVAFHLDCGWDDLGSWTSLESLADRLGIQDGPNVLNQGDLLAIESSGNIVDVAPQKLVALLGVQDLIIAEQGNAILIAHKDRAQEIRKVVDEVKKKRPELS